MSYVTLSANMNMPVPVVGQEPGPDYATDLNSCFSILDNHDHTPGYGIPIPVGGISIAADFPMNGNNLTLVRTIRFSSQNAVLSLATDLRCLYTVGANLYYNDGNGVQIAITSAGAVAGTPGSIGSLVSPASATYSAGTFVWQSAALTPANLDAGYLILRNNSASSYGLTIYPPSAMGADISYVLPTIPSSTSFLTIDNAGNFSTSVIASSVQPPGAILMYGGTSAPSGWLICDGSAVSRSTYSALFSAIGVAFGYGNNSTTFNIPDGRGQFARGVTGLSANDPDASSRTAMNTGGNTGNNVGSVQADATAVNGLSGGTTSSDGAHTHTVPIARAGQATAGSPDQTCTSGSNTTTSSNGAHTHTVTVTSSETETRPINFYVNYIIKT